MTVEVELIRADTLVVPDNRGFLRRLTLLAKSYVCSGDGSAVVADFVIHCHRKVNAAPPSDQDLQTIRGIKS